MSSNDQLLYLHNLGSNGRHRDQRKDRSINSHTPSKKMHREVVQRTLCYINTASRCLFQLIAQQR